MSVEISRIQITPTTRIVMGIVGGRAPGEGLLQSVLSGGRERGGLEAVVGVVEGVAHDKGEKGKDASLQLKGIGKRRMCEDEESNRVCLRLRNVAPFLDLESRCIYRESYDWGKVWPVTGSDSCIAKGTALASFKHVVTHP